MIYLSKYQELLDTFITVSRRRPVSWLALFHHIAIIQMNYWGYKPFDGTHDYSLIFTGLVNLICHVLMYSYFAFKSLGISYGESMISSAQRMVSNLLVFQLVFIFFYYLSVNPFTSPQCRVGKDTFLIGFVPISIMTFMFVAFFFRSSRRQKKLEKQE